MRRPRLGRRQFLTRLSGAAAATLLGSAAVRAGSSPRAEIDFAELERQLEGVLVTPGHDMYEDARRTASFNPRFNRYPAAIAGCRSERDIARSVLFARQHRLPVSVRSGGHDVLAASVRDGSLVIDTRFLTTTELDPNSGLMRVGGGAIAGGVNQAAGAHGRAIPLGCNSSVGVSGLTLGGGLGWFVGSHGATCDAVHSARVVTPDGEVVVASVESNPDLFWAIRGGGGNFGIVSEWTYRTHAQADVICGAVVFPGRLTAEFLSFYQEFVANSPRELTVEVLGNAYREPVIAAAVCYSGDLSQADRVLQPLRGFARPLADGLVRRPYWELERMADSIRPFFGWQPIAVDNEPVEHGSYWQGTTVPGLSGDIIQCIDEQVSNAPPGWSFGLGHVMRGACLDVADGATPLLRTPGATTVHFDAGWAHRSQAKTLMEWVDRAKVAVAGLGDAAPDYVNYLSSDTPAAVREAYGNNFQRLRDIKQRFDPDNVLDGNRNIRA